MSYLMEWESNVIKDFEQLLAMAEESSEKIDSLLQIREKQKLRLIVFTIFTYSFAATLAIFKFYSSLIPQFRIVFILASVIVIGACLWVIIKNIFIIKKMNRELHIEKDIHERLISLLDEQKQRLYQIESLSPVAHAVYEIRMRRIDRTDKKLY
ncbi:MAG: hypothetical protein CITR_02955 [Citrobacter freundii]